MYFFAIVFCSFPKHNMETLSNIASGIGSLAGRAVNGVSSVATGIVDTASDRLDAIAWWSPPVIGLMIINAILLIVVIVKLAQWAIEGFANPGEEVIMYYLPWCGACKDDITFFQALSKKYGSGVTFRLHDLGTHPVTGITASPTYIFTRADGTKTVKIGAYGSLQDMEMSIIQAFNIQEGPKKDA